MAKAAVGQITSTSSMTHNLSQCETLITLAATHGASALFLPEASDYIASSPAESLSLARSVQTSPFVLGVQAAARRHKLAVNVGVHEPGDSEKKVKNTSLWIDERGEIVQRYQKVHLFDVDVKGGPVLKESDSVEKGMSILKPFKTSVGRVGLMICFDLRFPEISLSLKRQQAQIITYPSAFTVPTGKAHWELLLRARAIETQSYVIAAAQKGFHNHKRQSYGHAMIVDPWGKILVELSGVDGQPAAETQYEIVSSEGVEMGVVDIDLEYLEKVRREMPLLRRTDVYPEI